VNLTITINPKPAEVIANGETVANTLAAGETSCYIFTIPQEANFVRITTDTYNNLDIEIFYKMNERPTAESYDWSTKSYSSIKYDPHMLILLPQTSQQIRRGDCYILIKAVKSASYDILAEYHADISPVLQVELLPPINDDYKYDSWSNIYYFRVDYSFQAPSNTGIRIIDWSHRVAESSISSDYSQYNFSNKIDDWFQSVYLDPGQNEISPIRHYSSEEPVGSMTIEAVFVGEDDFGGLVYGYDTTQLIGKSAAATTSLLSTQNQEFSITNY
jgi:hypothetical protein